MERRSGWVWRPTSSGVHEDLWVFLEPFEYDGEPLLHCFFQFIRASRRRILVFFFPGSSSAAWCQKASSSSRAVAISRTSKRGEWRTSGRRRQDPDGSRLRSQRNTTNGKRQTKTEKSILIIVFQSRFGCRRFCSFTDGTSDCDTIRPEKKSPLGYQT